MGHAFIGWYEDNGKWQQSHTENIVNGSESGGWRLFRQTFTTLPTTKRILLKTGLWKVQGTMWVDDVHLIQIAAGTANVPSRP